MGSRKAHHTDQFKVNVVLEALKGMKTQQQIATEFGIHPVQVTQWKKDFLENAPTIFSRGKGKQEKNTEGEKAELYEKIGRLEMENDWLKKKLGS